MTTGSLFRLKAATICIATRGDDATTIKISAGALLTIMEDPRQAEKKGLLKVRWNNSTVLMFLRDLVQRAAEVSGAWTS